MNCRDATALIEKLVDGEASESERSRAETHVRSCEACSVEKRFLERTAEAMKARAETLSARDAPEGYWESLPDRVLARIDEQPKRGGLLRAYPWMALAASLLVAVTVVLLTSREREGRPLEVATSSSPAPPTAEGLEEEPTIDDRTERGADAGANRDADTETVVVAEAPAARRADPSRSHGAVSTESTDELRSLGYIGAGETTATPTADELSRSEAESENENTDENEERVAAADMAGARSRAAEEAAEPAEEQVAELAPAPAPAPSPATPSTLRERALSMAVSVQSPCETLRTELSRIPEDARAERTEKLYELAQCSVERYETFRTDALRELAVSDLESLLAVEPESERAKALQQALTRPQ